MKSKKVLIVDDNDMNRKLFENLIGQFYQFKSAINGIEAIAALEEEQFDLVLMDIQMPQMDGITALKKIQEASLTLSPIIAVTAFAEESDRANFLSMGFADFITKPIRTREFLSVISSHLSIESEVVQESKPEELTPLVLDETVIYQLRKYTSSEAIKTVLDDFILESTDLLQKAQLALVENNEENLIESLHILKGNSGTLGANSIYLILKEAEKTAKNKNWDLLKDSLEKLQVEKLIFEKYINEEIKPKL